MPPRGNVSGRQLWVDESSEKNDYKAGGSWRSGSQGDNATGRQGEKVSQLHFSISNRTLNLLL